MEENQRKNSAAKIKANNKYRNSHYKSVSIFVKPDIAEEFRSTAKAEGKSLTQYLIDVHREHLKNKQ